MEERIMDNGTHISFNASDRSYFAILKKDIHRLATGAGFSEGKTGEIDIIVAEMASNLIKHAGGGEILIRIIHEGENLGIELISIDNGPGMSDTNVCLKTESQHLIRWAMVLVR